jgi:NADH-quinone oxidoreductase subunit K
VLQVGLVHYLALAAALFAIGVFGVLSRRNVIAILMSIELMLNGANINLLAFARYGHSPLLSGQVLALFVIAVAAAETAVGLAIILAIYRRRRTIFVDDINLMKW